MCPGPGRGGPARAAAGGVLDDVPGRKTDITDAQWLCQLMEAGLLRGSFVAPKPQRQLRTLTRYRKTQIADRQREANRLHKALEDTGIKLDCVATDILGASGRAMLDALVAGTTDPEILAEHVLAVDPTNANHVIAGGIALIATANGGASWTNVNGGPFNNGGNKIHPDHHALAFAPGGTVWVGDDGGVYHYTPSSGAVANANGNLNITQFYYGFNVVGSALLAGAQDNSSARTTSSTLSKWTGIFTGDGGPSAITPNDTAVEFIESDENLYVTTDTFASTLMNISPPALGSTGAEFTPPMIIIPNTATPSHPTVLYGLQDLYRTTNPTAATPTWTKVTSVGSNCLFGGTCVSSIAVSPTNSSFVYVGFSNGKIEVSTNGGISFTPLKAQTLSETYVTGISVSPSNPKAVTVSVSYHYIRSFPGLPHVEQYVYTTSPATGTWTTITGSGLPDAVSHVIYDGSGLLASTDSGVYGTAAPAGSSTSWTRIGTALPFVQTQDLFLGPNGLYAVTHGRGAWKLNSTG